MVFFTVCIAPVVNITLDRNNSSKLLRKLFPRNFIFGLFFSLLALLICYFKENIISTYLSIALVLLFLINLLYVMPLINKFADKDKNKKKYSKKFKILHCVSVVLYLIKMILSVIGIVINY
jgi:Na+-transporting methylmalonyl-CoA/oxaloacetate decarboxylase gamma subunit